MMEALNHDLIVNRLKQLPSLPSAVSELLASFSSEDVDIDHIAAQIARDQALTARVLRVANSSFYGLQSKVGTIHEAVVVLGFRAVRSMVLAVGMSGVFRGDQCHGFHVRGYFRHGVAVGLAARAIAGHTGQNRELAFTAGLLHDIGQLVLAANFSEHYRQVLAFRKEKDCELVVAERELLGTDHAVVGGMLSEAWRFPQLLHDAIVSHHEPAAAAASSLADLVHVADIVAHALGLSGNVDEYVPSLDRTAWMRLDLDPKNWPGILPEIMQSFEETCQILV